MQISPSLVQQPGWIPGVAGVLTALLTGSPHAQVDEVRLVGPTKYLNNAKALVIHIDDSTTLVVDSFTLTISRTRFTEKGYQIGDRLELLVSHCDPVVNLYDQIYGIRGARVEVIWPVVARGKSQ